MEALVVICSTVGGLVIAVLLFGLAWWVVARARIGNRKLREARRDPHTDFRADQDDAEDPHRDIPQ
jgi:hypothetical protein